MKKNKNDEIQEETQDVQPSLSQEEIEELRLAQNLPLAIIASVGSAIAVAILWAVITDIKLVIWQF